MNPRTGGLQGGITSTTGISTSARRLIGPPARLFLGGGRSAGIATVSGAGGALWDWAPHPRAHLWPGEPAAGAGDCWKWRPNNKDRRTGACCGLTGSPMQRWTLSVRLQCGALD